MSLPGMVFYFVFGGNVLVQWGIVPSVEDGSRPHAWIQLAAMPSGAVAALADGLALRYALTPLGLESLSPLLFVAVLFGYFAAMNALATLVGGAPYQTRGNGSFQASTALYAVAMMASGRYASPLGLLFAGAAASLGYLLATVFLDAIVERLELETVPRAFKGVPIRVLSAGLIALAFSGVEATFFAALIQ